MAFTKYWDAMAAYKDALNRSLESAGDLHLARRSESADDEPSDEKGTKEQD